MPKIKQAVPTNFQGSKTSASNHFSRLVRDSDLELDIGCVDLFLAARAHNIIPCVRFFNCGPKFELEKSSGLCECNLVAKQPDMC